MNENIDLTKILKDCPEGTKFYTPMWGYVTFIEINKGVNNVYPIRIDANTISGYIKLTKDGRYLFNRKDSECIIFPSKEQRDWSKFTAPWYKKDRFDPKTLKPFDKVLARIDNQSFWCCELFSFIDYIANIVKCCGTYYDYCIPYNDDTKHLVGTTDEAPEYYRYWED